MSGKVHDSYDRVTQETSKIKDTLTKSAHDVEDQFKEIRTNVTNYVKKNPLKTIGFSVLAGVVVAQILRKHNHHKK